MSCSVKRTRRKTAWLAAAWLCAAPVLPVRGAQALASPAAMPSASSISVSGVWARATAPHQDTGAVYLTVHSGVAIRLTGVASPDARMAMMHETTRSGGMSEMVDVDQVTVPAGGAVVFSPGGKHIMLMGLTHPLVAGRVVTVWLSFSDGKRLQVGVPIEPIAASGPPLVSGPALPTTVSQK